MKRLNIKINVKPLTSIYLYRCCFFSCSLTASFKHFVEHTFFNKFFIKLHISPKKTLFKNLTRMKTWKIRSLTAAAAL